jgi:hypothetical protein
MLSRLLEVYLLRKKWNEARRTCHNTYFWGETSVSKDYLVDYAMSGFMLTIQDMPAG